VKLFVRIFRTISTTQRLYETNDFSALLEARIHDGDVRVVRKQGICGDHDVSARDKNAHRFLGKPREE